MIHPLNIAPVEECWKNSRLSLGTLLDSTPIQLAEKPLWMSIMIIVIAIYSLLILDRIIIAVQTSWSLLFRHDRIKEYLDNNNRITSQNMSMVMILPTLALIFADSGISSHSVLYLSIALIGLIILKLLSIRIIGWLNDNKKKIEEVLPFFWSMLILFTTLVLPVSIIRLSLSVSQLAFSIYCVAVFGTIFFTSLFRIQQRIINARFSHIFCFLYLCALEILPFVLAIRLILV